MPRRTCKNRINLTECTILPKQLHRLTSIVCPVDSACRLNTLCLNSELLRAGSHHHVLAMLNRNRFLSDESIHKSFAADLIDNGDRLIQVYSGHRPFLANANFRYKERHQLTWLAPSPSQRWTHIEDTGIDHRWHGSTEDYRSFWSRPVDSDHGLVRARCRLHLFHGHISAKATYPAHMTLINNHRLQFQSEFLVSGSFQQNCTLM